MYLLGIILAISAGSIINLGVLLQKKVIDDHMDDPEFLKSLTKNPIWIFGILLQVLIGGAIFYMLAQVYIGPALVPGLMSCGMIVLAIGSIKILNETLKKGEFIGILLMISGIILLSMSQLSVEMSTYNILDQGFIIRLTIFTCIYLCLAILLTILTKKTEKGKGVFFALESGIIYTLTSVWIGPTITVLSHLIRGTLAVGEIILFIPALIIIVLATIYGIFFAQKAFKEGQANILSPLIGVPRQLTPLIAFFLVFMLTPPSIFSIVFIIFGLILVISSTFLLATRQVKLEEIKK